MDASRRLGQLKKGNLTTFLESLMLVFHLFSDPIKISRVILGNLNLSGSAQPFDEDGPFSQSGLGNLLPLLANQVRISSKSHVFASKSHPDFR